MKKISFTVFLLFSITRLLAQNDLLLATNPNNLPDNIRNTRHWIEIFLDDRYISDLQFSNSFKSDSKFMSYRLTEALDFKIPLTNGIKMHFKGYTTGNSKRQKSETIKVLYKRELQAYTNLGMGDFKHDDSEFYFSLACDVLKISNPEILAQTLNYFIENDKTSKIFQLTRAVNAKMKSSISFKTPDPEFSELATEFERQFRNDKTKTAIYQTFILGKDKKTTSNNLNRFFNRKGPFYDGSVEEKLQKLNNPTFELATENIEQLIFPITIAYPALTATDSLIRFDFQYIKGQFELQNKELQVVLTGKTNQPAYYPNLLEKTYNPKTKKYALIKPSIYPKTAKNFTKIKFIINEKELQVFAEDDKQREFLITKKEWPNDFSRINGYNINLMDK